MGVEDVQDGPVEVDGRPQGPARFQPAQVGQGRQGGGPHQAFRVRGQDGVAVQLGLNLHSRVKAEAHR
ncbi:hypothetical protein D3C81_2272710 [compost metagenome]